MPPTTLRKPARRQARSTFSDELRDAIDRDGRSPYAVAKAAGVDPGVISRFLAGRRGITSETIDRIAAALGLHLLAASTRARGRPRREAAFGPADPPEIVQEAPEATEAGPAAEDVREDHPQTRQVGQAAEDEADDPAPIPPGDVAEAAEVVSPDLPPAVGAAGGFYCGGYGTRFRF